MGARAAAMSGKSATGGSAQATRAQKRQADAADEEQRRRAAIKARRALEEVEEGDGPEASLAESAAEKLEEHERALGGPGGLEEEELLQG